MEKKTVEDAVFALASPLGESAIAIIRISGNESLALLDRLFRGRIALSAAPGHTIHHGQFLDPESGEVVDEIMAAVYRAPKSYTGEDSAELFTHGSPPVISAVMATLLKSGFRQAGPGEFTQRAFLNGKMDLTRAEAVDDLIRAKSDRARRMAISRLSGAVERRITSVKEAVADLLASVEIMIDYPDEDTEVETGSWLSDLGRIEERLAGLLATYRAGRIIQEGIIVVIAGGTNAGKSTLFNLILREDRAIVSEVHGTTRDYLEGAAVIEGIPVRLFDTAGLRATDDLLEMEGMRRTDMLLEGADVILFVVDAAIGETVDDREFCRKHTDTTVVKIWNKADLSASSCPPDFIPMISLTGAGIELLQRRMGEVLLGGGSADTCEPVIDSLRQKMLLESCASSLRGFRKGLADGLPLDLLAIELKTAMDSLGEITGEITGDDLLQRMFSKFCVGK